MTTDMENSPFTEQERHIMEHLTNAWKGFSTLEPHHPDDEPDFRRAIHEAQQILSMRILRRDYPGSFPIYKRKP